MKVLSDILSGFKINETIGDCNVSIHSIQSDSRFVKQDDLFVAVVGTVVDGHNFIAKAIELGASVIVCSQLPDNIDDSVTYVVVDNTSVVCSVLLSNYYNISDSGIKIIGVTGTNGKTTVATLLYRMFMELGYKVGLISTVANYICKKELEATHTTPDPVQLFSLLNQMILDGCQYCFMEVSSHAIDQNRVAGITFEGGIFTNITRDHLDYHKTFDEYISVKKRFFDNLSKDAFALVNADDKNANVMLQNCNALKLTYSLKSFSTFKCTVLEKDFNGMLLNVDGIEVWVNFIGLFNAYNLLAVYSVALQLGQSVDDVLRILSRLKPVAGRFECFMSNNSITGIVDYAHTHDALENVLSAISEIRTGNEQVITVVGAGGDRDKGKRPLMGKVASQMSDKVIFTSDNPRSEDPSVIAQEMRNGVEASETRKVLTILDRREAIRTAVALAQPGDIVLVAGKGHENYQIISGVKSHFDDKEELLNVFDEIQ